MRSVTARELVKGLLNVDLAPVYTLFGYPYCVAYALACLGVGIILGSPRVSVTEQRRGARNGAYMIIVLVCNRSMFPLFLASYRLQFFVGNTVGMRISLCPQLPLCPTQPLGLPAHPSLVRWCSLFCIVLLPVQYVRAFNPNQTRNRSRGRICATLFGV